MQARPKALQIVIFWQFCRKSIGFAGEIGLILACRRQTRQSRQGAPRRLADRKSGSQISRYCRALLRRKGRPLSITAAKSSATGRQTASP